MVRTKSDKIQGVELNQLKIQVKGQNLVNQKYKSSIQYNSTI